MPLFTFCRYLAETKPIGRDLEEKERIRAEQSLFVQEVLLATLTDTKLAITDDDKTLLESNDSSTEPQSQLARSTYSSTDSPSKRQHNVDKVNRK